MVRKFVVVSFVPVLLALFAVFGYPGSVPVIQAAGTPGALVPMGDALGDVGQYYSQIAPSMNSRTTVQNLESSSVVVTAKIYGDAGISATRILTCTLPANESMDIILNDSSGGVRLDGDVASSSNCPNTASANPALNGVNHMEISAASNKNIAVSTIVWAAASGEQINASREAYRGVAAYRTGTKVGLVDGTVSRDTSDWWDTEYVVQNTGAVSTTIVFTLCPDNGNPCFSNNSAVLQAKERRIFLLSQLAYRNSNGSLIEESGGMGGYVTSSSQPIAVVTNVMRQGVIGGESAPKAEKGALAFVSLSAMKDATYGNGTAFLPAVFLSNDYSTQIRIVNTGIGTGTYTIWGYNADGSSAGTPLSYTLGGGRGTIVYGNTLTAQFGSGLKSFMLSSLSTFVVSARQNRTEGSWGWGGQLLGDTGDKAYFPVTFDNYYTIDSILYAMYDSPASGSTVGYLREIKGSGTVSPTVDTAAAGYETYFHDYRNYSYPGRSAAVLDASSATQMGVNKMAYFGSSSADTAHAYASEGIGDDLWYVPFAPSPVVGFAWQPKAGTTHPSGEYGIAPAGGDAGRSRTVWLQDMNWVGWTGITASSADRCNTVQPDGKSRYVADWWGLGNATLQWVNGVISTSWKYDGSVGSYNTYERLSLIRNSTSSACAGRPLQIVNEANNSGEKGYSGLQGNMTFVELGRASFVFRTWPGDLYGPSFAYRGVEQPHIGHTCTTTDYSQGEAQARAGCHNGFMRGYFAAPGKIIPGQTLKYADIFDGLELHYYPPVGDVDLNDPNIKDAPAKAQQYRELFEALNGATGLNPNWLTAAKPIIITEYGMVDGTMTGNPPVHTPDLNGIADKMVTFDQIIDDKLGTNTPRFWFTDWCNLNWGSDACAPQHHADILFTASTGITLTVVGTGWHDSLKNR